VDSRLIPDISNPYYDLTNFNVGSSLYTVILAQDGLQVWNSTNIKNVFLQASTDPFVDTNLNKVKVAVNGNTVYYFVLFTDTTVVNNNRVEIYTSDLSVSQIEYTTTDIDVIGAYTYNYFKDITTFQDANNLYLVITIDP
jgi:hypothetical protein